MTLLISDFNKSAPALITPSTEAALSYPPESLKQYEEMTVPRDVAGEKSHQWIEKEKAASEALTQQLSSVTDEEIRQLLSVIDTLDFRNASRDSVLLNPKLPHIALEALRRGVLDPQHGQKQVATILNFWAALQYHQNPIDLGTTSIFDPEAEKLIKMTLTHPTVPSLVPFLEGDKYSIFMKKMQALPPSEQRFLLVPDIQGDVLSTVSQVVKATGVNVFNRLNDCGMPMRIIPSNGMMQAFLEAQYGDDAVEIKPRIYHSTLRHIYDTRLTNTSDMMMPTPDSEGKSRCPSTADGAEAPWYDFPHHDFYHSIVLSAIGQTYRKAGVIASDAIRAYAKTAPIQDQKGLNQLAARMIDMDYALFNHFFKRPELSQRFVFLLTINQSISFQNIKYAICEMLKQNGITPPPGFRADPISGESELGVFNALYDTFLNEGSFELDKESFQEGAVTAYKIQVEASVNKELTTAILIPSFQRLGRKLGVIDLTFPWEQPVASVGKEY